MRCEFAIVEERRHGGRLVGGCRVRVMSSPWLGVVLLFVLHVCVYVCGLRVLIFKGGRRRLSYLVRGCFSVFFDPLCLTRCKFTDLCDLMS